LREEDELVEVVRDREFGRGTGVNVSRCVVVAERSVTCAAVA
jgi:hypothetical protein